MLFYILFIIGGLVLDQLTKYWAVSFLSAVSTVPVVPHVFHLTYVENTGAAFSIFAGKQVFLIVATLVFVVVLGYFFYVLPKSRRYFDINMALSIILSGALGNLIDRVRLNYVIDFFDVRLIGFAIFNIADILVVAGCFLMIIALFRNKDLVNDPPSLKKKRAEKLKAKNPLPKASPQTNKTKHPDLNNSPLLKAKTVRKNPPRKLEPKVLTKIETLPEHHTTIDFNPTPPEDHRKDSV